MKIIFGDRQTGKTIQAIMTSHATGATILCKDERRKEFIRSESCRLRRKIPDPITITELRRFHVKPILIIDDLEEMLEGILERDLGCQVLASFMSVSEAIEKIGEDESEENEDEC